MEYIKLRDICNTTQGIQISKEEQIEKFEYGYIRYLYIADFKNDDNKKFVINNYSEKIVTESDLVMANTGSPGAVFKGINGVLSNNLFKISLDKSIIDRDFLYYYLSSKKFQDNLKERLKGGVQKHLGHKTIGEQLIPVIDLSSQKKIVNVLDKAQGIINKRKEQIEALDELVKSQFIEMFGELKTNENNFDIVDLESLTTKITDGVHSKPEYTSEGVEFISVKDINKGKLNFDECKYISQEAHERYIKRCRPEIGDVLYTKVGATYGIPAVVDTEREFSLYVSVALLKLKKDIVNPIYIKEALRSVDVKRQADRQVKGIGVPDLHLIEIKKFKVFNPPIELQNKFADFVKQVDKLKFEMEKSLKDLEDSFNSLMQKAFNGELLK